MITFLNLLSFALIFFSLLVCIAHPRINLPAHLELIMFTIAIGAAAMAINALMGKDMYGYQQAAETLLRLGLGGLIARFVYDYPKDGKDEDDK